MRRAVAIVLATAALGACSGGGSGHPRWRSAAYGYTIERPAEWTIVEASARLEPGSPPFTSEPATDILAPRASRRAGEMELPAVVVGAQPVDPATTLADWQAQVEAIVDVMKGCDAPAAVDTTTVGGERAAVLEYPACPPGETLDHVWVALVHDDLAFQIVWFTESGAAERDRPAFDRILASLEFVAAS